MLEAKGPVLGAFVRIGLCSQLDIGLDISVARRGIERGGLLPLPKKDPVTRC